MELASNGRWTALFKQAAMCEAQMQAAWSDRGHSGLKHVDDLMGRASETAHLLDSFEGLPKRRGKIMKKALNRAWRLAGNDIRREEVIESLAILDRDPALQPTAEVCLYIFRMLAGFDD